MSVDRHGAWLLVAHASTLEDALSILAQVKEEAVRSQRRRRGNGEEG
jgi:hypothetical protein